MSVCPKCNSSNVLVGAFVLSCESCGWHHLNKYPCTVCGKPSVSSYGSSIIKDGKPVRRELHGCEDHPVSKQLGLDVAALAKSPPDHGKPAGESPGGVALPLEFSDEIVKQPVIYGELVPLVLPSPVVIQLHGGPLDGCEMKMSPALAELVRARGYLKVKQPVVDFTELHSAAVAAEIDAKGVARGIRTYLYTLDVPGVEGKFRFQGEVS